MKKRGFSRNTSDVLTKTHRYNRINIKKHLTSDVSKKATVAMTMAADIVAAMPEIAGLSQMYLACVVAAVAGGATGFLVALVISFFV